MTPQEKLDALHRAMYRQIRQSWRNAIQEYGFAETWESCAAYRQAVRELRAMSIEQTWAELVDGSVI